MFNYFRDVNFEERYILPEKLHSYLLKKYSEQIREIGKSTLGKPIYLFSKGTGNINILAWSQMHGDESNSTLAMLDLLFSVEKNPISGFWENVSLDFIFMLNPDGSSAWQRRNALDIDINRDYMKESSIEMKILKEQVFSKKYDYALNLHEQRTVFSTDWVHPATLSFLAPSESVDREITENRKKSMVIISEIYEKLKQEIPENIGRYTDEFYPTSSGDNLMKAKIPVILFEGGHFEGDYFRKNTREYYTKALFYALEAMIKYNGITDNYQKYFEIPENKESHYDLVYRNVKLNTDFHCALDIAVQYKEIKNPDNQDISFIPYVVEVGDIGKKKGWKEIDCTGKKFVSDKKYPKLDAPVSFQIV